jgi:glucose-6-phosphate 1-dehydrogenase
MSKPKALFIFGGTGDLARKKLFPALARIAKRRDDLRVVYSIARSKREDWEGAACNLDAGFTKLCHFIPLDAVNWEDYKKLGEELQKLKGYELIFYLSLLNLGRLLRNFSNPRKVVVEKPFGFDLQSARKLNSLLYRFFVEEMRNSC